MNAFRSSVQGRLPSTANPVVDDVPLPPGRLVVPNPSYASKRASDTPCLWISEIKIHPPGEVFGNLVDAFPRTGLWPVILDSLHKQDDRPWIAGELDPGSSSDPSGHDVEKTLQGWWKSHTGTDDFESDDELDFLAPFGREFPRLAPNVFTIP